MWLFVIKFLFSIKALCYHRYVCESCCMLQLGHSVFLSVCVFGNVCPLRVWQLRVNGPEPAGMGWSGGKAPKKHCLPQLGRGNMRLTWLNANKTEYGMLVTEKYTLRNKDA